MLTRFINLAMPYEFAEESDVKTRLLLFFFVEIDQKTGASLGQLYVLNCIQLHRRPKFQLPERIF